MAGRWAALPRCGLPVPLALVFPGQGSQRVGMAADLFKEFPTARRLAQQADDIVGFKLSKIMAEGPFEELCKTEICQPALLLHSVAVYRTLKLDLGVDLLKYTAVIAGHSLGEFSALVCARALRFSDAMFLVRERGLAMQRATSECKEPTKMTAVITRMELIDQLLDISARVTERLGEPHVCNVANMNAVSQLVLSGTNAAVDAVVEEARKEGIVRRAIPLPVTAPFHSKLMEPVAATLDKLISSLMVRVPTVPVLSNVTSQAMLSTGDIRTLLVKQAYSPVLWHMVMSRIMQQYEARSVLELGTGSVLSTLASKAFPDIATRSVDTAAALRELASCFPHEDDVVN